MNSSSFFVRAVLAALLVWAATACDHGLTPPEEPDLGVIRVHIEYLQGPSAWPPDTSFHDFRFVALRFVPEDPSDLLQLNRLIFTDPLTYGVAEETVVHDSVETGPFFYSGVAQKFGAGLFDWKPLGIVTENDGIFIVTANETTDVRVVVDFENPPPFPP